MGARSAFEKVEQAGYILQLVQLAVEQLLQELPVPATLATAPLALLVRQAKPDITLPAWLWHSEHDAPSLAWLMGRISSNFTSHLGQKYS